MRVGPELEIPGYGCLDHFLEGQSFLLGIHEAAFTDKAKEIRCFTLGRFWPRSCRIRIFMTSSAILECEHILNSTDRSDANSSRPVIHKNVPYNCRVIIYNGKILLIRPKMWMANDGNYVRTFSILIWNELNVASRGS